MPMKMKTVPVMPNVVYFPQIILQTGVNNGSLATSCQLVLAAAEVNKDGKWTPSGHTQTIYISDIANLEEDIAHLAPQVAQLYAQIVSVVEAINTTRKVL